jgi:hypothetical protein
VEEQRSLRDLDHARETLGTASAANAEAAKKSRREKLDAGCLTLQTT